MTSQLLIVDDEPRNLELIAAIVSTLDVAVTLAESGHRAIDAFARTRFDLVLLDVMMPGLDGLATLKELRARTPHGEHIPIVLVTALDSRADRLRGLDAGADDFLTKPVDAHEVRCRVRTFLALRSTQLALRERAEELERVQRAKAELAAMIVHDLKNPLAAISGNVRWIANRWDDRNSDAEVFEAMKDVSSSTQRLLGLVGTLIDVEKAESGSLVLEPRRINVAALLHSVVHEHRKEAGARAIALEVSAPESLAAVVDALLVTRVIENLLLNALRYAGTGGRIALDARAFGEVVELSIANTGRPIPEELRASLFEKYATTERRARGDNLGLGLYFSRLVAERHGGTIAVAGPTDEWPTRFVIRLPTASSGGALDEPANDQRQ